MIEFKQFTLTNGLRVIVNEDKNTPLATLNILYDVGARDENPEKTGFAHLFEHLMFGGSINIEDFDRPIEMAGGHNNAFTSNDMTNYYDTMPAQNLETAFWLESDRMLSLGFSPESLETQRKVVCEEFKEHYINQPYGDVHHLIREMAYTVHPYQWPTIGKNLKHVEDASLDDVKSFFKKHYCPANAIMVVAGNVIASEIEKLANKWFASIPAGSRTVHPAIEEPRQTQKRTQTVYRDVPANAIYMAFHAVKRTDEKYYTMDLLTDILSNGKSSRLYQKLCKENPLFSSINCYHTGSNDNGLIQLSGKLNQGISMEAAETAIWKELEQLRNELVSELEIEKHQNMVAHSFVFNHLNQGERAFSLAYFELLFGADRINTDLQFYKKVNAADIQTFANQFLLPENCSVLYYLKK